MVSFVVHLVAVAVGEVLLHQIAPVGGGVHRHIGGPGLQTALQHGLQHGVGQIVLVKGQIVDEQDELLGTVGQHTDELAQIPQVGLVHPQ